MRRVKIQCHYEKGTKPTGIQWIVFDAKNNEKMNDVQAVCMSMSVDDRELKATLARIDFSDPGELRNFFEIVLVDEIDIKEI